MNMIMLIGRKEPCDLVIKDSSISRQHAKLISVGQHTYLLEDMESLNGTYVNDLCVKRAIVTKTDAIRLGTFETNVGHLLSLAEKKQEQQEEQPVPFTELETVWKDYLSLKKKIQNKELIGRAIFTGGGMALASLVVPFAGALMAGSTLGNISFSFLKNDEEKRLALESEFKNAYVCPKCNTFLGFVPYAKLAEVNKCSNARCKTKWL
jgi:pSer/pThr/pTyr-binding forkhead associated (FHA) protein